MRSSPVNNVPDAKPGSSPDNTIVVLLVDDQMMVGEAIRRALLGESGVEFRYCGDPNQAIATAKEVAPTVILQDLVMPGVDGLELVRRYRADPDLGGIPIIVLSTKEEPAVKSEAFRLGANDYLVKLPDKIELIARVRYHSQAYLTQRQRDEAYRALHESQQQLLEINRELKRLTNVDGLTGVSNRRYFNEYLETEWKRSLAAQTPLSVLMVDVDHFKRYNDTYGHLAGDEVLKKVAGAIAGNFKRSADLTARYGGEEFAVILPNTPMLEGSRLAAELSQAVEALALPHSASTTAESVTISVGCATTTPAPAVSLLSLVDSADKALYEAKRTGRNRAVATAL